MKRKHFTYQQVIALTFLSIIIIGGVVLSLPVSSRDGTATPLINALFTSASATCITGLVVYDTYTHWSAFGQAVILLLIQIGGLGFMTVATLFSFFLGRKIGLWERVMIRETVSTFDIGGVVRLTKHIIIGTLICEGTGALLLSFRFCPEMGFAAGLYNAVFHSVSAFCNAGFDIMGKFGQYSSLTRYAGDPLVNLVVITLIVVGGIGFVVWEDIYTYRFAFRKYQLHSKIVLVTTGFLIFIPAAVLFATEYQAAFAGFGVLKSVLVSLFQSVTTRTAGFNTVDLASLKGSSVLVMMVLMLIGGSPGSTAGGAKTTTFVVILLSVFSTVNQKKDLSIFKRRLDEDALRRAVSILFIYIFTAMVSAAAISLLEGLSLVTTAFEVLSAIGTVGLSFGITPYLGGASKIILAFLMYFGRVGVLSIAMSIARSRETDSLRYPSERIMIG